MAKKFQLKNGMKVILLENHKSPVVSAQLWVKTGSADESLKEAGISHFIEHLLFKGTRQFKMGEIAAMIEGSGGSLNAYTSFDQTVYHITISKDYVEKSFLALSEMLGYPQFDSEEIDKEREVVVEEIKMSHDRPGQRVGQLLFSTAYKKHPYGVPVIGYEKIIRKVTRKAIVDYFHKRYTPSNMFLVVAGDINPSEIKNLAKEYFESFVKRPLKKVKRKKEPLVTSPRINLEKAPFEESHAHFGWPIPQVKHKDIPALDLLSMILGQGDSSRLVKKLRIEKPLVNSIGASTYTPIDPGLFLISMSFNTEKMPEILTELKNEIDNLFINPPTSEEIAKAITMIESDELYSLETVDGIGRKAGYLIQLVGDENYLKKYLKQIRKLTSRDLVRVAQKYFQKKATVFAMLSQDPELKKQVQMWVKNFKHPEIVLPPVKKPKLAPETKWRLGAKAHSEDVEKIILNNNTTLLLKHSDETPVISAKAVYWGGVRAENANQGGLTEMLSRTWMAGTKNKDENQLFESIEKLAASISTFSGRNTLGLNMEVLTGNQKPALDLFIEVMTQPSWPTDPIERERHLLLEQIKNKMDNPAQIAMQNFMKKLFGDHPYSRELSGTLESVPRQSKEDIISCWRRLSCQKNLSLVVTGNFNKKLWVDEFQKLVNLLPQGEKLNKTFPHEAPQNEEHVFQKIQKEQSHVVLGYRGLTFTDEERYALEVMQAILAGQGGRLFIELRDKESLAYSVSPIKMEGVETGYFGAYIGCSPEKVEKAISMMRAEFTKLCEQKVPEEELLRAQTYLVGRNDIDLQRSSTMSSALIFDEIYGLGYGEVFKTKEKIRAVTVKEIQDIAQRIFGSYPITSIVGP